ncbi:hypothetical protein BDQ17DRAFT_1359844 [Cyathus striatus]|nr:hypothetical protein BDQ17DRAFT_1359844 [Cyathus striatus]
MDDEDAAHSRPRTPESPMASSLYHASSTIDELTTALANFSRIPSPEPMATLTCCCGKEDCENLSAWLALKSRLDSRLILSAEKNHQLSSATKHASDAMQYTNNDELYAQISELMKEKAVLEKRLNQALVNNEVTEVSSKTILQELQEARETISRLTAHHVRSVGWDAKLAAVLKEKDDMQQERDSESNRARLAESRFAVLRDKTVKLQAEVRRLQTSLEEKRQHRLESSESLIQEARGRLESIQKSQRGLTVQAENSEIMNVLESLVRDNESLKRDNAELQELLADSREDLHALQEEIEEQRAHAPSRSGAVVPRHSFLLSGSKKRRSSSVERRRIAPEPLTPETSAYPLSPTDSFLSPTEGRWTSLNQPYARRRRSATSSSHVSYEVEDDAEERPRHKTLLLLTRSRGVQTDGFTNNLLSPSPLPSHLSHSPHDAISETSSFSETLASQLSVLLDKASTLLNRMAQADALTLTNRLKRQNLKADSIMLRSQFRSLLEDEKIVLSCTRKDLRILFKFFKDAFTEMGHMRVTLNDVILDPTSAPRISELALNPAKVEQELREKRKRRKWNTSSVGSWVAPIQKLFAPVTKVEPGNPDRTMNRSVSGPARPARFVPKLRPALAASATTVNVEFSGSGVGRSTTSTFSPPTVATVDIPVVANDPAPVMSIFAGAPQPSVDPWVVLSPSKHPRRVQSTYLIGSQGSTPAATATIGRSTSRGITNISRLSRNVDAVIDGDVRVQDEADEETDNVPPLLQRTLRRRGLSDSSINSTFTNHGDEPHSPKAISPNRTSIAPSFSSGTGTWADRFQAFSRTVQNLRSATLSASQPGSFITATAGLGSPGTSPPRNITSPTPQTPRKSERSGNPSGAGPSRAASPLANILPNLNLASWAAGLENSDPFLAGTSVRDESTLIRTRRSGEF